MSGKLDVYNDVEKKILVILLRIPAGAAKILRKAAIT
jgi:hypothetical protein